MYLLLPKFFVTFLISASFFKQFQWSCNANLFSPFSAKRIGRTSFSKPLKEHEWRNISLLSCCKGGQKMFVTARSRRRVSMIAEWVSEVVFTAKMAEAKAEDLREQAWLLPMEERGSLGFRIGAWHFLLIDLLLLTIDLIMPSFNQKEKSVMLTTWRKPMAQNRKSLGQVT